MTRTASLLAVGDLLLCGRYDEMALNGRARGLFEPLGALTREADLVVGNMECVLSRRGSPRSDKLCLRGEPAYAGVLALAGFDLVSLANNHSFDYGTTAFEDTRDHLEGAGVRTVGAGTAAVAQGPVILERGGLRIGFLAYCHGSTTPSEAAGEGRPGVALLEPTAVMSAIRRWRPQVDQLVLLFHWGLEYSPLPTPEQVELAHQAIDAGAGAVIGHHSHMLQGIEHYGNGVIAYSLGNCTDSDVDWHGPSRHFTATMTDTDREGLALALELNAHGVRVKELYPLWLNDRGQPEPVAGDRGSDILRKVDERSQALKNADLSRHWEGELVDKRVLGPFRHWWNRGSLLDKLRGFRPSQLKTLFLLVSTYVRIRFSRSETRWSLFNPRNDKRPMPYAGRDDDKNGP